MRDRTPAVVSICLLLTALAGLCAVLEIVTRIIDPDGLGRSAPAALAQKAGSSFRKKLPPREKGKDESRILVLGDSFSWGDGVEDPSLIWPSRLEKDIRNMTGKNVTVINMSVCGFTTVNELEVLIKGGEKYRPDIVLLQYLLNDVLPSGPGLARVGEDYLDPGKRLDIFGATRLHSFLKKKSYFYVFLNNRFRALQRAMYPARQWRELYADGAKEWQAQKKALFWIGQWSAEKKVPVVMVMFPLFGRSHVTPDNFEYKDIYRQVEAAAVAYGIKVLDLLPFYCGRNTDFRRWAVSVSDPHPNAEAHRLAATAVSGYLYSEKLVKT